MTTLYICEPGAVLRRDGESWVVTAAPERGAREILTRILGHQLRAAVLLGRVHATTEALHLCLAQAIMLAWLDRGGRFLGRLTPRQNRSPQPRLAQYRLAHDPEARLARARTVAVAKVANAAAVLRRLQSNRPGRPELGEAIAALGERQSAIEAAPDPPALLGAEGMAARGYFAALRVVFPPAMPFAGRARRPPPDPVNALLSLGYVLLGLRLSGLIEALGLDPAIGFLHELRPGRDSLALDILEELRHPLVDLFVLRLCNLAMMRQENFEPDPDRPGGVRLCQEDLKRFLRLWEEWLDRPLPEEGGAGVSPNHLLRRQVERLTDDLRGGAPYRPFRFRG